MIKEKAYAKINLALDVYGKRKDGYHELKMIMIPIELHDLLIFEKADMIELTSNIHIEQNAVIKTVNYIKDKYKYPYGVKIHLEKNIPIGSGLAGGSADIAATIRGLNQLWELNLDIREMEEIAITLGSDTLFCLHNKPAYVYGRGERLLFVENPPLKRIFLCVSNIQASTKRVFENHHLISKKNRFNRLLNLYINEKYTKFFAKTYNDLTKSTIRIYPELNETYRLLKKSKLPFLMTGSGSTFYVVEFLFEETEYMHKLDEIGLKYIETKPKN